LAQERINNLNERDGVERGRERERREKSLTIYATNAAKVFYLVYEEKFSE